jgi:hypothetical protein
MQKAKGLDRSAHHNHHTHSSGIDVETHEREIWLKALLGKLYLWPHFLFGGQMVALDPFLFLSQQLISCPIPRMFPFPLPTEKD